jgi:integrase/recombinase XerD
MALGKQAKILTKAQQDAVLGLIATTRYPIRNRVIFLLSVRAGLRAKEIASLKWEMVTDAEGSLTDAISLTNSASKGQKGGRVIPMSKDLRTALGEWRAVAEKLSRPSEFVIVTERATKTSSYSIVNLFAAWYRDLGFVGASSHSGRRTAITKWARQISTVGGSLRDVQLLAGHSALTTTQRYIEGSEDAKRRVVEMV